MNNDLKPVGRLSVDGTVNPAVNPFSTPMARHRWQQGWDDVRSANMVDGSGDWRDWVRGRLARAAYDELCGVMELSYLSRAECVAKPERFSGRLSVSGIAESSGSCERVYDENAQFFSVYADLAGGRVECIGDFGTREQAEGFAAVLTKAWAK